MNAEGQIVFMAVSCGGVILFGFFAWVCGAGAMKILRERHSAWRALGIGLLFLLAAGFVVLALGCAACGVAVSRSRGVYWEGERSPD
jgi:hypothetical protein